ncbi:MAG: peptidase T [Planctomycetota bacterium]
MLNSDVLAFVKQDVRARFLRYVQIYTTSDDKSETSPSTARQMDLLRLLAEECRGLGLADVHLSDKGCVYATLPPSPGVSCPAFGLLAHVDTSPEQPGENVKPVCHENWDGKPIKFADDPTLTLTTADSTELADFVGDTIITASGLTLLGADDKAGVAEIMSALTTLKRFPQLQHGKIVACFTSDEEIGRGTRGLELERLPQYCYTLDGSYPGELEHECFDAWRVDLVFHGVGVHPGLAKDKLVNASTCAARFLAELPERETPEHTDGREGFFYVTAIRGGCERAEVHLIVRDFEIEHNRARLARLEELRVEFERRFPRLRIELATRHQYQNMRDVLLQHPRVTELAERAIQDTGLKVIHKSIRGGTDGSALSQLGHPTPNIFAGGMMFHSRREWVAASALNKAVETIVHLARRWM